jgi:hypothetical protein
MAKFSPESNPFFYQTVPGFIAFTNSFQILKHGSNQLKIVSKNLCKRSGILPQKEVNP